MKSKFLVIICFLHSCILLGQNQNSKPKLSDSIFSYDKKLLEFKTNIQADWNFRFQGSKMIISCKDSIWLAFFNAANISMNDTSERKFNDSIYLKNNGGRILPEMTFLFDGKWSKKMKQDTIKFNNSLYQEIIKLKAKYHLENLQEWHKWGESAFIGATPKDEENIKAYEKEKKAIEARKVKIPSCSSSHYSIFIEKQNWVHALPNMIPKYFPKEKIDRIDQMVEDLLQVHGGEEE